MHIGVAGRLGKPSSGYTFKKCGHHQKINKRLIPFFKKRQTIKFLFKKDAHFGFYDLLLLDI